TTCCRNQATKLLPAADDNRRATLPVAPHTTISTWSGSFAGSGSTPASATPSAVGAAPPATTGATSRTRTGRPNAAAMRKASAAPARSSRIRSGGSTKHTSVIGEDVIDGADAGKAAIQDQFRALLDVLRIVASAAAGVDHRKG